MTSGRSLGSDRRLHAQTGGARVTHNPVRLHGYGRAGRSLPLRPHHRLDRWRCWRAPEFDQMAAN